MKKLTSKLLAVLLGVVMIVAMLPAVSASGDNLRSVVVNQTQAIMDVEWTLEDRIYRTDVTGDLVDVYKSNGIRPTTYFEYRRMQIPLKGVIMSPNNSSLEQFSAQIDMSTSVREGIGHINPNDGYVGMSMHSFLVDLISRVSPTAPATFQEALTHEALVSLLPGANLKADSSKAAISGTDARAAYSKLGKGDLLLAWDNNANVGKASDADSKVEAPLHVMVVKEVSGDQVTVMYPAYSQPLWTFKCKECGAIETEGPTSSACPNHVISSSSYMLSSYKYHKDTQSSTTCDGMWWPVSGTTWRTETVSFDALLGENDAKVPYACAGYLPYTLAAYSSGAPEVKAAATTQVTASTIAGGFSAKVTSNYRIVAFDAVLTASDGTVQHFESAVPSWNAWSWEYNDPALDLALLECKTGKYNLTLYVKTGPVTDPSKMDVFVPVYSLDMSLGDPVISLTADKSCVIQAEDVTVTLTTKDAGLTAVKTALSYDPTHFTFDAAKSSGANVTFTDDGKGTVGLDYAGGALANNATLAKLVFTAKSTGNIPVPSSNVIPIKLQALSTSKTPNAKASDFVGNRAEGVAILSIGWRSILHKNYAADTDLLLVYVDDPLIVNTSTLPMRYDGKTMHEVTSSHYSINGNSFVCIFAYLGKDLDPLLVTMDESVEAVNSPEITYSTDVNQSGFTDINDAQTISNIYNGKLPLEDNLTKWLLADINRNGKVDVKDRNQLIDTLMKK